MQVEIERKGTEINFVIGNSALEGLRDGCTEQEKIRAHLNYVEKLLTAEKGEGCEERGKNIAYLRRYWEEGLFPVGEHYLHEDYERRPNFRDSYGNVCAVGYLIQHSPYGGERLVRKITENYQFSYVKDMDLPELVSWQDAKIMIVLDQLIAAQPGSDNEKAGIRRLELLIGMLASYRIRDKPEFSHRLMSMLNKWKEQHGGQKQVVDELVAQVWDIVEGWLQPEGSTQG